MSDVAISVEHLSKRYKLYEKPSDRLKEALGRKVNVKEHYALDDVNFQIQKGECVGIIGTNGSGKSTVLKIITGVVNPTEGEVKVDGRISALLELGAGFNMEYTGLENIYLNGTMIGFSREEIDQKLDDILSFADIGEFVHQPVKTYSSGMFVRLAFAVAINIDPEILIVDEALSVGDVFFQSKCYRKFEEFKKMGKTIVFVSHDLGSISRYCDRVILLNKGVILDSGNPKEMINLYKKVLVQMDGEKNKAAGKEKEGVLSERNYRVDKLDNIKLSNIPRAGKSQFRIFNANTYVSRRMGMFSGKEQVITVRIPDTLVGPFIDQFGKRITLSEYTEGMLLVTFNAVASVILLGWLLGLQYVEVLEPQSVRNAMTDLIKQNMEIYSKKN